MLKLLNYESHILEIPLTGKPLSGMFPWEVQWLINKVRKITGDILEIGTFRGATARELATAHPNLIVHIVDNHTPWYGLSVEELGAEARELPNVRFTIEDSKTYAYPPNLGMVIIDGDHSWEGVKADTQRALDYFRGRQGTIIWHDYDPTHEVMPYLDWFERYSNSNIRWVQNTMLAVLDV